MGQQFSRQALHALVWSAPRTALAKTLGLSDVGLAKACAKAGIPMPPRGHWARLAAGKRVVQSVLPPRALGQSNIVQVGNVDARACANEDALALPPEPVFEEPLDSVRARAAAQFARYKAPRGLQRRHRLIEALLDEDATRRKALETDRFAWRAPGFDLPSALRRVRVVNALFMTMAHARCSASVGNKDLDEISFRVGDTGVTVRITSFGGAARTGERRSAAKESMMLKATGWPRISGVPSEWADSDSQRLETRIVEIARDLLVMGEMTYRAHARQQHAWRVARKNESEHKAREARERQERETRQRHLQRQAERRDWLLLQAANLTRSEELRALVQALDARAGVGSESPDEHGYRQWRSWALAQADLLDPRLRSLDEVLNPPGPDDVPRRPGDESG